MSNGAGELAQRYVWDFGAVEAAAARARRDRRGRIWAYVFLACYLVALSFIAFWPEHIDKNAGAILRAIREVFPWATYARVEWAANVALFVLPGWLLSVLLGRYRLLVVPIALGISSTIEFVQFFMPGRTSSLADIVANTLGATVGMVLHVVIRRLTGRARR